VVQKSPNASPVGNYFSVFDVDSFENTLFFFQSSMSTVLKVRFFSETRNIFLSCIAYAELCTYVRISTSNPFLLFMLTSKRQTHFTGGWITSLCLLQPTRRHLFLIKSERYTLTLRRLMSYTYGAPILDVSRSHTTTQHSR